MIIMSCMLSDKIHWTIETQLLLTNAYHHARSNQNTYVLEHPLMLGAFFLKYIPLGFVFFHLGTFSAKKNIPGRHWWVDTHGGPVLGSLWRHEILKGYIRAAKTSVVNYALLDERCKSRLDVPFIPCPPPVPLLLKRGVLGKGKDGWRTGDVIIYRVSVQEAMVWRCFK